jgi:hypothetical protein
VYACQHASSKLVPTLVET